MEGLEGAVGLDGGTGVSTGLEGTGGAGAGTGVAGAGADGLVGSAAGTSQFPGIRAIGSNLCGFRTVSKVQRLILTMWLTERSLALCQSP